MYKPIGIALGIAALVAVVPATSAGAAPADEGDVDQVCIVVVETEETSCGESRAEAEAALGTRAAWTNIASFYDGRGFSGTEVLLRWESGSCSASYDREFEIDNLRDHPSLEININNWISSVRTYNGCDVKLHDYFDFQGPESTWIDESSNLSNVGSGWLNRASSLEIS